MNGGSSKTAVYEKVGDLGSPLVMLHGWGMHSGVFGDVIDDLAKAHTLYLVDLPGHGQQRERDWPERLADWIENLLVDLPPGADWLGWSLGGLPALIAAARPTGAVRRLILASCNPCFVARADWPEGMNPTVFAAFARELTQDPLAALVRFIALEVQGGVEAKITLRQLKESALACGPPAKPALEKALALLGDGDFRPLLPTVRIPVLVLGGTRDKLTSPKSLAATAQRLPAGRLTLIEGAAHAPFLSHRRAFVEAVSAFL